MQTFFMRLTLWNRKDRIKLAVKEMESITARRGESVNIQDIKYIAAVAEEGSVNRAARRLFVSQPSLSKCIKRIEQEYGVKLFCRNKGSALGLTVEGTCFLEMANEVLLSHDRFEERIKQLRFRNQNNIIFGTTMQCAYDLAGPLLKWIYEKYQQYFLEIRTNKTAQLEIELLNGSIDIAMICTQDHQEALHYEPLYSSWQWIYLRRGSRVAEKAVRMEGLDYPVLRLEDLEGEEIAANVRGSGSRSFLEAMMKKAGVYLNILELPNWNNRLAAVERGRASFVLQMKDGKGHENLDRDLLYLLHPDQNIEGVTSLACRSGFQKDPRFQAVLEGVKTLHQSHKI